MASNSKIEVIIPFASRLVARDWQQMCRMLQTTLDSALALPTNIVSVSILGHEPPESIFLNDRCRWTSVKWPPPSRDDVPGKLNDKGVKLRQGVQDAFARKAKWVMFLDADDLLSNRLPDFCDLENHDAICFDNGFSWVVGTKWLQRIPEFHRVCGTSWIMRLDPRLFPMWLGPGNNRVCDLAHNERYAALNKENARIQVIRDPMAIYRIGHLSATGFGELLGRKSARYFLHPFTSVKHIVKYIVRRERLTSALREEFCIPD